METQLIQPVCKELLIHQKEKKKPKSKKPPSSAASEHLQVGNLGGKKSGVGNQWHGILWVTLHIWTTRLSLTNTPMLTYKNKQNVLYKQDLVSYS